MVRLNSTDLKVSKVDFQKKSLCSISEKVFVIRDELFISARL